MSGFPVGPIMIPPMMGYDPAARLHKRKDVIHRLCQTLEEFLSLDIDTELENLETMKKAQAQGMIFRGPSPEMLADAQLELQQFESNLERVRKMGDGMPEDMRVMADMQASELEKAINFKRKGVKHLQDQLDGKTFGVRCRCGATLMEDGSAYRGFVNPGEMFAGTREGCDAKAIECGWTVNGDEHTCPECAK